jgi:hypothetical protein
MNRVPSGAAFCAEPGATPRCTQVGLASTIEIGPDSKIGPRQQPLTPIVLERGDVVVRIEVVGRDLVVGVETKGWQHLKAPD